VTCSFDSRLGSGGFVTGGWGANESRQSNNWYGQRTGWVEVTCGGTSGRKDPWNP
jgi:hypothetical protein